MSKSFLSVSMDDPLPERMAAAALWLEEASARHYADPAPLENIEWSPASLRHVAAQFREEDAERAAVHKALAEMLQHEILGLSSAVIVAEKILMHFDVRARPDHPTGLGKVKKTDD